MEMMDLFLQHPQQLHQQVVVLPTVCWVCLSRRLCCHPCAGCVPAGGCAANRVLWCILVQQALRLINRLVKGCCQLELSVDSSRQSCDVTDSAEWAALCTQILSRYPKFWSESSI